MSQRGEERDEVMGSGGWRRLVRTVGRRPSAQRPAAFQVSDPRALRPPTNYPITRLPDYSIERAPVRGFTIIELLVVLALISILATMGMAQYRTGVVHAREAVLKTDLFDMRDAIDQHYADKGQYPVTLDALVTEGYIRRIPVDPFTDTADSWQTILSEADPNDPTAPIGIFDVKSGSDRIALDGTPYADW